MDIDAANTAFACYRCGDKHLARNCQTPVEVIRATFGRDRMIPLPPRRNGQTFQARAAYAPAPFAHYVPPPPVAHYHAPATGYQPLSAQGFVASMAPEQRAELLRALEVDAGPAGPADFPSGST